MLCAAVGAAEIWTAVLAALLAGTLQNWVFPFFTYVPSSGMFGEVLPQVRGDKGLGTGGGLVQIKRLCWAYQGMRRRGRRGLQYLGMFGEMLLI
jgi:membrane-associated protease RseP (regulator of RpoE activity)